MTLNPNQANFQMGSDKQKQMQVLAYLYQGGDPRLEYVKADKSVAAQEFIRQNQEVFDAYNTAMAQFAGKTVPQKNGMAQVIAWYITKGQWWKLDDPNLNAAAWTAYNNIVKLAGQPLKLWEAYQALKKNQNIKDKQEYEKALAEWKKATQKAIAEQDELYKTNSQLLSSLKIAVYRASDTQFRIQLTGSSQAAAMLEKYGKVTLTGKNVKLPKEVTIAQLSEGILVDAEVPAGTACDTNVTASVYAEFSGDMETSAIYVFSKAKTQFQRQVILNKYKIHVSGNSSHSFDFKATCPVDPEPSIGTTLEGTDGAKAIDTAGKADTDTVTLTDKVAFKNLKGGQNYVIKGELVDGDGNSVGVTAVSDPFDPKASGASDNGNGYYSGTINIKFQVPVAKIRENAKLVA
ncbi:MAG: VaFE repeat-containing surface-anchored protein, partial [Varibaculum timonense]